MQVETRTVRNMMSWCEMNVYTDRYSGCWASVTRMLSTYSYLSPASVPCPWTTFIEFARISWERSLTISAELTATSSGPVSWRQTSKQPLTPSCSRVRASKTSRRPTTPRLRRSRRRRRKWTTTTAWPRNIDMITRLSVNTARLPIHRWLRPPAIINPSKYGKIQRDNALHNANEYE